MVFVNSLFVVNGADFTGTKNRVPRMHCTYYAMSSIIDAVHCAVHVHECAALSKHTKQAIDVVHLPCISRGVWKIGKSYHIGKNGRSLVYAEKLRNVTHETESHNEDFYQ